MKKNFGIVVMSSLLNTEEKKKALRIFSEFYNNVSPKHQKRIKLIWCIEDDTEQSHNILQTISLEYRVPLDCMIITLFNEHEIFKNKFNLLTIHPTEKYIKTAVIKSFELSIPIISINTTKNKDYVSSSCGMLVSYKTTEQIVINSLKMVEMLYFDEEVLKIMGKNANEDFERKYAWGLKQFRNSRN